MLEQHKIIARSHVVACSIVFFFVLKAQLSGRCIQSFKK